MSTDRRYKGAAAVVDGIDTIGRVDRASRNEWLSICDRDDSATFFHTPHWVELFERGFGKRYRASPQLLRLRDDTTLLLPMAANRRLGGLFRTACSMPGGTFGGWLSGGTRLPGAEGAATAYLDRYKNMMLRENPYRPLTALPAGCLCVEDHTRAVDLTAGYDAAWMRATAAHRNAVRNAARRGVEIHEAAAPADWEAYTAAYRSSIGRWKKRGNFTGTRYPPFFFSLVEKLEPSMRTLFCATVKGQCIAGILCFYWNRHAVVWHGAGLAEYFSYHPNNLLYDRAIAHAVKRGCAWLDCNPSGGLPGVDKFKQYLGAEKLRSRLVVRRSPAIKLIDRLRGRRSM